MDIDAAILALATAPSLAVGPSRTEGGQPVRRFRKELIRTGQFVKPSDGLQFEVTQETLRHWTETFAAMSRRGIKVPIPVGHDRADDPEANRGWLVDVFPEGDRLVGIIDLVGKGIELAGTSDTSIYCAKSWSDSLGNSYQWPILHVALCTDPVIPGLDGFVELAASRGGPAKVGVLRLSTSKEINPMTTTATTSLRDSLAQILGAADLTDDQLKEKLLALLGGGQPADVALSREPKAVDPLTVKYAGQAYAAKLDALVAGGNVTKAVRDKLAAQLLGPDNRALALALSNDAVGQLDAILDALAENRPAVLGERTQAQVVALSDPRKGPEPLADEDLATMRAAAGVKVRKGESG